MKEGQTQEPGRFEHGIVFSCNKCGERFKTDVDLQSHLFNNRHCEETECPECLRIVLKTELKSFGGLCEECTSFNE